MTTQDDLSKRARANSHDLGATAQDRAEYNVRRKIFSFIKEADDAAASTATAVRAVFRVPAHLAGGIKVVSVHYTPDAAVTASDTDNATITFGWRDGAGGSETSVATYQSNVAGGSLVAHTPKALTLAADANLSVPAGGVLTETIAKTGSGVALQAGSFSVVYDEV